MTPFAIFIDNFNLPSPAPPRQRTGERSTRLLRAAAPRRRPPPVPTWHPASPPPATAPRPALLAPAQAQPHRISTSPPPAAASFVGEQPAPPSRWSGNHPKSVQNRATSREQYYQQQQQQQQSGRSVALFDGATPAAAATAARAECYEPTQRHRVQPADDHRVHVAPGGQRD